MKASRGEGETGRIEGAGEGFFLAHSRCTETIKESARLTFIEVWVNVTNSDDFGHHLAEPLWVDEVQVI